MGKRGRKPGVVYAPQYHLDDLRRRLLAGETIAQLARSFGVTRQAMHQALIHRGLIDLAALVRAEKERAEQDRRIAAYRNALLAKPTGPALAWAIGEMTSRGHHIEYHQVRRRQPQVLIDGTPLRVLTGNYSAGYYRFTSWRPDTWYLLAPPPLWSLWQPGHEGTVYIRPDGDLRFKAIHPYALHRPPHALATAA